MKKITVKDFREMKGGDHAISMLTAYDASMASLLDQAGVDSLLVGDSLGMVVLGYDSTVPVTMEEMLHHAGAVSRGAERALVIGDIQERRDVLVRVHSECFTGDTLGSLRCDCGPQLQRSMQLIAEEELGVIVYLRQEGRNIGLLDKLRAYNLQDEGYDTVDANLMLGHQADNRDYIIAALILKNLGVQSARLLTNNPQKIEDIRNYGIHVSARIPLQEGVNHENLGYLITKAQRMRHMLDLNLLTIPQNISSGERPFVTLSYAQSLDGSIAARQGEPLLLSGAESMMMTHRLRADHDAILVGIGTVLADDPRLSVRLVDGQSPQPIILDSQFRFPATAQMLSGPVPPWIVTLENTESKHRQELEQAGTHIIRLPANKDGRIELSALLATLSQQGIRSLMVEGGARVITSFLTEGMANRLALTITPNIVAGLPAIERTSSSNGAMLFPRLLQPQFRQLGNDIVVFADFLTK